MINEVEDGELSSDQEQGDQKILKLKSKGKLGDELILNNEEKNVLKKLIESGTESGEISDLELENPYVEEDEMMIQLKIKALKSVLDANQQEDGETSKPNKKGKRLRKKSKIVSVSSESDDGDIELNRDKLTSQKNRFKYNVNKKTKLSKNKISKQKEDKDNFFSNLERTSLSKLNPMQNYPGDNYNLEDMDIESPKVNSNDSTKIFSNTLQFNNYFGEENLKSLLTPQPLSHNFNFNNMFSSEFAQRTAFAAMFNPSLVQTFNNMWFNDSKPAFQNNNQQMSVGFDHNINSFTNKIIESNGSYSNFQSQTQNDLMSMSNKNRPALLSTPLLPTPKISTQMSNLVDLNQTPFKTQTINSQINLFNSRTPNNINRNNNNINKKGILNKTNPKRAKFNNNSSNKNIKANKNINNFYSAAQNASKKMESNLTQSEKNISPTNSTSSISPQNQSHSSIKKQKISDRESENKRLTSFLTSSIDIDERFIDKTTASLDIDYRQANSNNSSITENKSHDLNDNEALPKPTTTNLDSIKDDSPLKNTENAKVSMEEENKKDNEEDNQDDDEMIQLRMNLLNNLNEKRTIKKQKQLELEKEQVKQIDEDISIFKKKLIEHEQELMIDESKEIKKKIINSSVSFKPTSKTTPNQLSTGTSSLNNLKNNAKSLTSNDALPKISPVIIRLNSNETDSDEELSASETNQNSTKQLESNIDLFLKEAKILAELKSTYENRKRAIMFSPANNSLNVVVSNLKPNDNSNIKSKNVGSKPEETENSNDRIISTENFSNLKNPTNNDNSSDNKNNLTEQQQKTDKDKEKKNIITTLRDRINLKSKAIEELKKKSMDLKKVKLNKEKDVELMKQKISMLREQLSAAEKILNINEKNLATLKNHEKNIDTKLIKLQNLKKVQQELLQKILASTSIVAKSTSIIGNIQKTSTHNAIENQTKSNPTIVENSPSEKLNLLQLKSILTEKINKEKLELSRINQNKDSSNDENEETLHSSPDPQPSQPLNLPNEIPSQPSPPPPPPPPPPPTSKKSPQSKSPLTKSPIGKKLPSQMTLGGVVAATVTASSSSSANNSNSKKLSKKILPQITRPNLYTSKQTNIKLEQMAIEEETQNDSRLFQNNKTSLEYKINTNENVIINSKVVNINKTSAKLTKNKSKASTQTTSSTQNDLSAKKIVADQDLKNRQKLNDCLDKLLNVNFSHNQCESFDTWSYETLISANLKEIKQIDLKLIENNKDGLVNRLKKNFDFMLTSANYFETNKIENSKKQTNLIQSAKTEIHLIEDISKYESPLKVFRGYRFNSNFSKFNQFEEAYSRLYCNAIDFRKPFCPFDLHGSCKDSNCIYQHSNVMTMDNFQRTEHFLSYCPNLLELSESPTPREAVKKLKAYAKTFMSNNLNRMSIRDYFKFLYDHIINNLKLPSSQTTILSRLPVLCLNNNKSIGVNDNFNENFAHADLKVQESEPLLNLLDQVLLANMNRLLDIKLRNVLNNGQLDLNWIRNQQKLLEVNKNDYSKLYLNSNEIVLTWIFYARHVYVTSQNLDFFAKIEKVLNVLCNSLESNPKVEILWLIYLKVYLLKKNSSSDYHEICMLCLDNIVTYDLVWFMFGTCKTKFLDILFERYEKHLLNLKSVNSLLEFEQNGCEINLDNKSDEENDSSMKGIRISFYLCEMILYNVYLKLTMSISENLKDDILDNKIGIKIFHTYLQSSNLVAALELNDLCLMWLCFIHLEAFNCMPSWLRTSSLFSNKISQYLNLSEFWYLETHENQNFKNRRNYNKIFFESVNLVYNLRNDSYRSFDIFVLPWMFKGTLSIGELKCDVEKIKNLFHEALKSMNSRLSVVSTKQKIYQFSLPLFINLIILEVANKRFEIANKFCQRLLKSPDTEMFKELWLSLIYIQQCNLQHLSNNTNKNLTGTNSASELANLENTINSSLNMFPFDAQITFLSSKYYSSLNQKEKAIDLIETFIRKIYQINDDRILVEVHTLFEHFLGLKKQNKFEFDFRKMASSSNAFTKEKEDKFDSKILDAILDERKSKLKNVIEFVSNLFNVSILYCYYMELKCSSRFTNEYICNTYVNLIKSFKLVNYRSILWTRYFKYISSNHTSNLPFDQESYSNTILTLISNAINDLDEVSISKNNLIIPFNYLPNLKRNSLLFNHFIFNNNFDLESLTSYYYLNINDCNNEENIYSIKNNESFKNQDNKSHIEIDYFYHNCFVNVLFKLYAKTLSEKFLLAKFLSHLMPYNTDLIKTLINFGKKVDGVPKTLQLLYDHLCIHSVDNEHLKIIEIEHETITLSDGCKLAYRMWLPANSYVTPSAFTVPTILEYLPYRKRDGTAKRDELTHPYFAGHGYACIRVDMRGSGESDGLLADEYLQQEQDDAIEIIRWITEQPWSNAKVGMMGISWGGFNSLQIAAQIETHLPDTLKAIITLCSTDNRFTDDIHYKGGCLLLENAGWAATMLNYSSAVPDPILVGERWREMWLKRLKNMPLLLKPWLEHQTFDNYWKHGSICVDYSKIKAAVYAVGGWGDAYSNAIPRMLENLPGPKKGLIGPWAHKYPHFAIPAPAIGFLQEALRWWDYWLKGNENGLMNEPQITIYVQNSVQPKASYSERPGVWLRETCWPSNHVKNMSFPLNDKSTKLGFHLSDNLTFIKSPLTTGSACGEYCVIWLGPEFPTDQRYDDAASLVINTLTLETSLAIVGATALKLRIRSDSKYAQLAVRLNDVAPDGASTRITYGILNLNSPHHDTPVKELIIGEWFDVDLKLDDVGYLVPAGHKLRVAISTAYFPLIWPSKDHAKLEIDLNRSNIILPIHDLQTIIASPFEEPEAATPLKLHFERQSSNTRQVIFDAMTGRVTTQIKDDFGRCRFESHGLIVEEICEEKYSILPNDPLSASSEQNWTYKAERGEWKVETKSFLKLTAQREKFIIKAEQTAWENDKKISYQEWSEDVPRIAV